MFLLTQNRSAESVSRKMSIINVKRCFEPFTSFLFVVFLLELSSCRGLRCRDEDGQEVDWFVNYKLPKLDSEYPGSLVAQGKAYAYISSRKTGGWKLSTNGVTSSQSMLARSLQPVYDNLKNSSYLFYNDEPPAGYNGTSNGHLKGVVAFDGKSGFWLVHSIPKAFGVEGGYAYPDNALDYGQSVLCVSLGVQALDEICNQLLHTRPCIYERRLTDPVEPFLSDPAKSLFSRRPRFNKQAPYFRSTTLYSEKKVAFRSFVKDGKFDGDIYSAIMAPGLQTPLSTETWRRGSGTYLPPACDGQYDVTDVASIRMTLKNVTRDEVVHFKSTDDHSKWAVTTGTHVRGAGWICVGDMNRMASQGKRGGGSLCFQSTPVVKAYQSLIDSSDQCPDLQSLLYRLL